MESTTTTTAATATTTTIESTPTQRFCCRYCDVWFGLPTALGGHMTLHRGERAHAVYASDTAKGAREGPTLAKCYHCKHCDKKFECSQALGGHMTAHRGEAKDARDVARLVHGLQREEMIDFFRNEKPLMSREAGDGSESNDSGELDLTLRL